MAANIWDKYDEKINEKELEKQIKKARENTFEPLPDGTYTAELSTLELVESKTHKPMVKIAMRVTEGKYRKRLMFMNRVIGGTKNDGSMISGMENWLSRLEAEDENGDLILTTFHGYAQFADLLMDIKENIDEMGLIYEVEYEDKAFDPIKIKGIME